MGGGIETIRKSELVAIKAHIFYITGISLLLSLRVILTSSAPLFMSRRKCPQSELIYFSITVNIKYVLHRRGCNMCDYRKLIFWIRLNLVQPIRFSFCQELDMCGKPPHGQRPHANLIFIPLRRATPGFMTV